MRHFLLALVVFSSMSVAMARTYRVGQGVVFTQRDGTHYNARILEIYQDGKVKLTFPNGEYTDSDVSLDFLSTSLERIGNFYVDDNVIFTQRDGSHYNAKIVEIFEDAKVRISFPNGEYAISDVSVESLSKTLQSNGRFEVNQSVIFTNSNGTHYNARILEIFTDGKVKITFPNGEYADSDVTIASISLSKQRIGRYEVNDEVIFTQRDGAHYHARILTIYEDGKIKVTFPNGEYSDSEISIESLSMLRSSIGRFQVNESVIFTQSERHFDARILEIYEDGKVKITFPNGEYADSVVSLDSLSELRTSIRN
jgi:hypothetical protein